MARMRRKFADVMANQRRGLRSIGKDRHPYRSPIGSGVSDYYSEKGGKNRSMLRNPFSRYQTNPREEFISRFDGGYPIDNRIIETNLMPDTQKDNIKSILDFLRATEDQGKQYIPESKIIPIPTDFDGGEEFFRPGGIDQSDTPMLPDTITSGPSEDGNFFIEPGYEPSPITTPFIPPDYEISPMEPYDDRMGVNDFFPYDERMGVNDTTRGDLGYAVGLDAFNKYNMYNPRQEGLDYTPPTQPRPSWDNPVGNFLRKIGARLFNRGGIASLIR